MSRPPSADDGCGHGRRSVAVDGEVGAQRDVGADLVEGGAGPIDAAAHDRDTCSLANQRRGDGTSEPAR